MRNVNSWVGFLSSTYHRPAGITCRLCSIWAMEINYYRSLALIVEAKSLTSASFPKKYGPMTPPAQNYAKRYFLRMLYYLVNITCWFWCANKHTIKILTHQFIEKCSSSLKMIFRPKLGSPSKGFVAQSANKRRCVWSWNFPW